MFNCILNELLNILLLVFVNYLQFVKWCCYFYTILFFYIYNCYLCTEIYSWCSSELYFYIYSCTCIYLLSGFFPVIRSKFNNYYFILSILKYVSVFFLSRREFISYFFMCQIDTRSHCIFMPMIIFDKRSKVNLKLVIYTDHQENTKF